jgi:hypothetical protein
LLAVATAGPEARTNEIRAKNMKQLVLIGSFLALLTVATFAAPADDLTPRDKTPEATVLFKVLDPKPNDHKWRVSLAGALQRYCESVLVQVPRNTPQEDRWLEEEDRRLNSELKVPPSLATPTPGVASGERMATIMNSPQSARKTLRHLFSNCSSLAKKLPEAKSPATAALLWLQLSLPFLVEEFIWHNADIVGLVSRNDCQSDRAAFPTLFLTASVPNIRDKNGLCRLSSISFVVLKHIVEPFIEAQAHANKNNLPSDQPPPAQALNSQHPGPGWYKQGAGPEEFQRMRARCLMNASMTASMSEGDRWALILMACMRSEGWTRQ